MQSFLKTQPKEMPTVLEAGTLNGHGIAGLHAALNYILNVGTEQIKRIECQRMRQFYEGIKHSGCRKNLWRLFEYGTCADRRFEYRKL